MDYVIWNRKSESFKILKNIISEFPNKEKGDLIFWKVNNINDFLHDNTFLYDAIINYEIDTDKVIRFMEMNIGYMHPRPIPFDDIY